VGILIFHEDLYTKQIYIVVNGEENALYTLTVSIDREISVNVDPDKKDQFNYVVVAENIQQ
jgi:hypothetical protein